MRASKENFKASHEKTVSFEKELKEVKKKLEEEQKSNFILGQKVRKLQEKEDTIKTLQLKCLKSDYDRKKDILNQKMSDSQMLIGNLTASYAAIGDAMDKLNGYSATLYCGRDILQRKYEERMTEIEKAPASNHHTEINFEINSIEAPNLDCIHLNIIKLLTSVVPYQVKLMIFIYL